MSDAKHTAGPWVVLNKLTKNRVWHRSVEFGDRAICTVHGPRRGSEEQRANARLIAAAPAQNEALLETEHVLEYAADVFNSSNFTDRHGMGPEFSRVLGIVRTAIAAARGEGE